MEPGTLKRRASQSDDGSFRNAEDFMSKSPSSSHQDNTDEKERSLISAGKKRGPIRRKSSASVSSTGRGRPPKRRNSSVQGKRLKRQGSILKRSIVVQSDEAPTRLVNPLIEWPPAVNDPYIDPNKKQRLSVATPVASVTEIHTNNTNDAALQSVPTKANEDIDVVNVKHCGRVGDMVQMLDLERPDTFPLTWQAQLLGLALPEVISIDDDIAKQVRDANPIKPLEHEEATPIETSFQWSWERDEDDETKLLSERDPVYVSLLETTYEEEKYFKPISPAQYNRLHQTVVLDAAPILTLAQECGLWGPGVCSFSLMQSSARCFGWEILSDAGLAGYITTQVEWYSASNLHRNELVSRWQSFKINNHQWLDDSLQSDYRRNKEIEQCTSSKNPGASIIETLVNEKNESSATTTAVEASQVPKDDTLLDQDEASTEGLMVLIFSLALEHARACGVTYISIENMSCEWKILLKTYFRMTVKQEIAESKKVSLVCDLLKISYRYAFLLFQQRRRKPMDTLMRESTAAMNAVSTIEEQSSVRWIASIAAPAVISSEQARSTQESGAQQITGAPEHVRPRFASFRAKLSPSMDFMTVLEDGISGEKIEPQGEEVNTSFCLVRAFPRPPKKRSLSGSEVCAEINSKQRELASLEQSLQPKLHDLMVSTIKERIEYEKLRDKREKERHLLNESVKLIERRREQDMAFKRQQEQDMEAVCEICGDGEVAPDNQMVFCESCDVAVHQICYGIEKVPEGDYYCYACTRLRSENIARVEDEQRMTQRLPISCELCPLKTGAFVQTATKTDEDAAPFGKWIHVVCAKWQGLRFERSPDLIEDVADLKMRFRQHGIKCALCHGERGAMNKCRHEGCTTWIHVTCARAVGNCEVIHGENAHGDIETNPWTLMCPKHSQIPIKDIPKGSITSDELVLLASEFPPEPLPPPMEVVPRPFNTVGGEERERLLRDEKYERALLLELTTKRMNGYRCEVCDTLEEDGKNMLRCSSCLTICCTTCTFESDVSDGTYKCQSCRFMDENTISKEECEVPACLVCCQKGGVLRRGYAKTISRKSYWKNNPNEFQKSLFGKPIWVHSVCAL